MWKRLRKESEVCRLMRGRNDCGGGGMMREGLDAYEVEDNE